MYTAATLRHFMSSVGIEEIDDKESEWCFVSVCDPDDLPILVSLRKRNPNKKIVLGGFESWFGIPYLAYADHVVIGEGFGFFETFAQDPDKALALPNVLSKPKQTVRPDYSVRYDQMPVVRLCGGNRYYYLGSRGCHRKCRFCGTSWVQPYSQNDTWRIQKVVRMCEDGKRAKLTLISNDSMNLIMSPVLAARSVGIKEYLDNPTKYKSNMLHIGIEGWTERDRRTIGKPISDPSIQELFMVTKANRQQIELFFIAGLPNAEKDGMERFIDLVPYDPEMYPKVWIKVT
jgi:radical SAM superfamily enzyme YgiQ (UPF0313 family)